MLRYDPSAAEWSPSDRFAVDVLVDQSRLLRVEDPSADVVTVKIVDVPPRDPSAAGPSTWWYTVADGTVAIARSALAHIYAIAGTGAEQQSEGRDRHGRVLPTLNPLAALGLERRPLVTEAAVVLRTAVTRAAGRRNVRLLAPWPDGARWAAAFTHDVDVVAGWPLFTALRLIELTRKREFSRAARVVGAALRAALSDPAWSGMADVVDLERAAGVRSTWFFLCGTPTLATWRKGDLTYRPDSESVRRVLDALRDAGAEVGLHGSFDTYADAAVFEAQRSHLTKLTSMATRGVRQHFLRLDPSTTPPAMRTAGFDYDATFGFSDRNGFRLGSADILPSTVADGLDEVPLVWMDRALSKYRGIEDPERWIDDALELAATARAVDGLWVGLWHCNLTPALGYPGAPAAYRRLVTEIRATNPYVAPLQQLVDWRRARRTARATVVAPDGRIVLSQPTGPWTPTIEAPG